MNFEHVSSNNNPLTEIFLSAAGGAFLTVRSTRHSFLEKTLLPFSYPPVLDTPEHDFCSTLSTYPISRRIWILINPSGDAVDIHEQVELYQGTETIRLGEDV